MVLTTSAETKQVEFKETFDPADSGSLCETGTVAMNSLW
jgi:hypothetical protein